MYIGVLDGSKGSPGEVVLVETVRGRNKVDGEVSEGEQAVEKERLEIEETYFESNWEVLRTQIREGWLGVGRAVDPGLKQAMEVKETLGDRRLGIFGVHLSYRAEAGREQIKSELDF